jgi:hypothetical protein
MLQTRLGLPYSNAQAGKPDLSGSIFHCRVKSLYELKQLNIAMRAGGNAKMRLFAPLIFGLAALVQAAPAHAGQISSLYTSLDLEKKCKLVASNPDEGGWAQWSCTGHKGMHVRVAEGDLRFFVSFGPNAGKQTAAGQTLAPFNNIHKTLEWRVERKGKEWVPFATILRYFWDSDGRKGETLIVTKLGKDDACHVAHIVANGNPKANEQARKAADMRARTFKCGETQTMRFGPGGELLPN